jgi:protein gp37
VRIPTLLDTPAAVRFVSAEPLLGPLDLSMWLEDDPEKFDVPPLDWVIVGGESGPKARPMHPSWAREIRDQCTAARVPFLFKQWGAWGPNDPNEEMHRWGKKAAGRLLDGRTWDEYPGATESLPVHELAFAAEPSRWLDTVAEATDLGGEDCG